MEKNDRHFGKMLRDVALLAKLEEQASENFQSIMDQINARKRKRVFARVAFSCAASVAVAIALIFSFGNSAGTQDNLDTLDTLTPEFFIDGSAEVIKYGVLEDEELFKHLMEKGLDFEKEYVISRCIEIKRDYVVADEFDTGLRRKLNLGHTVGHAVENRSNYGISHGRAVAIGMAIIARACQKRGICSENCLQDIIRGLEALHLPTECSYTTEELITPMLSDKKRTGATISLIVPNRIGDCDILPLPVEELENFVKSGL